MRLLDRPAFAPLRSLMLDPEVSEILINGPQKLFVEKGGQMIELQPIFATATQLEALVDALLAGTGRTVTARSPMVDFRLEDGSRVNICIPPIALQGATITIRRFSRSLRSLGDLVQRGTLTPRMAHALVAAVRAKLNVVFAGGTGSGKTTTLGILASHIPPAERVVVIEDTAELDLPLNNCVRLECRPPNLEGTGSIVLTELLKNSLRMRPNRILVGEVRGEEAFEMIHAMSSGHDGSMGVLHASTPAHAISRLEVMLMSRGLNLPLHAIQKLIASSVDLVLQHALLDDGVRRVTSISEVAGADDDGIVLRELFGYHIDGPSQTGTPIGRFVATGIKPKFYEKLRRTVGSQVDELLAAGPA